MCALEIDVRPGSGVGMFELGASLWSVLDILRQTKDKFPHVDVKYDPTEAATSSVILTCAPISLLFTGITQRLHTIAVSLKPNPGFSSPTSTSPPSLTLTYKSAVLSSSNAPLLRGDVNKTFGPTFKGKKRLIFPGIIFEFEGRSGDREEAVEKVVVLQRERDRSRGGHVEEEEDGLRICASMLGDLKKATVNLHTGITLSFFVTGPTSTPLNAPVSLLLGVTTAEDLLADLGPPLRIHYKQDDRLNIHSALPTREGDENSYFYNYFQYGLDFLLSGETHRVVKIVVHSNVVGSALFQRYKRCPWEIRVRRTQLMENVDGVGQEGSEEACVTICDKADTLTRLFSPPATNTAESDDSSAADSTDSTTPNPDSAYSPPPSMILDRAAESGTSASLVGTTTRLLGFDGVVVEVGEGGEILGMVLF